MFVHRNLANVVERSDINCMSVVQFAVDVLKVKHIIVCGHYGCAGVQAAERGQQIGLADDWLGHVRSIRHKHAARLEAVTDESQRAARLCELNVIEQVVNVCQTTVCHAAWTRGQELTVHGWIYAINDGLLRDLGVTVSSSDQVTEAYQVAVAAVSF
jgi:carbonic anhydrase